MRAADVRRHFIEFFVSRCGHTAVPSSPVVPYEDPTLLFTNAGMNQFKDVFLGRGTRPYTRAVDTQKCIRAGGKHNDLEDVGKDVYHHTFFEMLGNWSFGDYFKRESIDWAWELLTKVYGLDSSRLYATYFGGHAESALEPDNEARDLWCRYLPAERVLPGNMKDNFWEMGDTGPCGPCSEIHFDRIGGRDAASLVNSGDPDVLEVWNLVFIQFNREQDGSLRPLPAKHVDTGMGLERIVSVVQGKRSNYDTDLWSPIFDAIARETGARPYSGSLTDHTDIAYRVIADHIRCLTVAACDGAAPGAEGRNYVLRRILRRAARHGRQTLGTKRPFLHAIVPAVVETLGGAFPEIASGAVAAAETIHDEEKLFGRTLDRGLALFADAAQRAEQAPSRCISAEDAFKLHDTWGFPIDLTEVMASERGLRVDDAGYRQLMEQARETSRGGKSGESRLELTPDALARLAHMGARATDTSDMHHGRPIRARIVAIWNGTDFDADASAGPTIGVILDQTNMYAESGGQEADSGELRAQATGAMGSAAGDGRPLASHGTFEVRDVQRFGDFVMHIGAVTSGRIGVDETVTCAVHRDRRDALRANHTATHLLNWALREVVGDEVEQRGSLVSHDRLRFDYAARGALGAADAARVEELVNAKIAAALPVHADLVPLSAARKVHGLRAVFGERYPDPVRLVSIGATPSEMLASPGNMAWRAVSAEFCGGTHLASTDEAQRFVLASESALSAGVRRVMALTGGAAMAADMAAADLERRIAAAGSLAADALLHEVNEITKLESSLGLGIVARARIAPQLAALRDRAKSARRETSGAARDAAVTQARELAERHGARTEALVAVLDGADAAALMAAIDSARARLANVPILFLSPDADAGKVAIAATCPAGAIAAGLKAGDWVRAAAQACGGSGGGKPDTAQAGGKDPAKVNEAAEAARAMAAKLVTPAPGRAG
jgi:alanyl-tRNA synthetase